MRILNLALAFLIATSAAYPTYAELQSSAQKQKSEPDESKLVSHDHYTNNAGQTVHSPSKSASDKAPQGASAKCRDGSYSFSKNHRGTCSHHGGVANWL